MCIQTGPDDLKNTKHLKCDIRQIFDAFLNKMEEFTFSENFKKKSVAHVKIVVCFFSI